MNAFMEVDQNIPKFLDAVLDFMDAETNFGLYETENGKMIVNEAIERHFKSKTDTKVASKTANDSFDELPPPEDDEEFQGENAWKYGNTSYRKKSDRVKLKGFPCKV